MLVDLHTHTTSSDGTLTPESLVRKAKLIGLEVLAITDHDTISAFYELGNIFEDDLGIKLLRGVEISVEYPTDSLHIIGYNFKDIDAIGKVLNELLEYRNKRNEIIIQKMNEMGFSATLEEIKQIAKGEAIGRPHFARLMANKGYVRSIDEAFEKYLRDGGLLFVEKRRLKPKEAIDLIKNAGGIAILAHPFEILRAKNTNEDDLSYIERLILKLVDYGLDGIEVFYSTHTPSQTNDLLKIARKYDLMITAGSDFHGDNRPSVKLGMDIPYKLLSKFLCAVS
ncbi:MAG: PHP domain-containing protein [Fervidobacterium sp.]|nr:PHP domain-containing protein [Fervidobacterium sp.]